MQKIDHLIVVHVGVELKRFSVWQCIFKKKKTYTEKFYLQEEILHWFQQLSIFWEIILKMILRMCQKAKTVPVAISVAL